MRVQTEYQPAPPSSTEGLDPPMKRVYQPIEKLCWYDKTSGVGTCGTTEEHSRRMLKKAVSKAAADESTGEA
jgi:hypothetical protein